MLGRYRESQSFCQVYHYIDMLLYMYIVAPIKALCSERYDEWQEKFGPLGLKCCELTGDSQLDDYFELQNANIVLTTPVSQYNQV